MQRDSEGLSDIFKDLDDAAIRKLFDMEELLELRRFVGVKEDRGGLGGYEEEV